MDEASDRDLARDRVVMGSDRDAAGSLAGPPAATVSAAGRALAQGQPVEGRTMLTAADNERIVLTVLAQRYGLPLDRVARGETRVVELPDAASKVQAYAYHGGVIAGTGRDNLAVVREELAGDPSETMAAMERIASRLGGRPIAVVNRTGVEIAAPAVPVAVTDADDPRLPAWVRGYFTGTAW